MALTVANPPNYADFKTILSNLPRKFTVFYYTVTSDMKIAAVSSELDTLVWFSSGTVPGSFGTDFPNAVLLSADFAPSSIFALS